MPGVGASAARSRGRGHPAVSRSRVRAHVLPLRAPPCRAWPGCGLAGPDLSVPQGSGSTGAAFAPIARGVVASV
eukprot:317430-Alexandrium_andersonii.AAC.1